MSKFEQYLEEAKTHRDATYPMSKRGGEDQYRKTSSMKGLEKISQELMHISAEVFLKKFNINFDDIKGMKFYVRYGEGKSAELIGGPNLKSLEVIGSTK